MRALTLCCVLSLMTTTAAVAQPPVVFPTPFGPGVQLPFTNNDSVVDYGFVKTSFGWAFDGFQAFESGDALTRFVPTLQGPGALTPMGEANDWVYHMEFSHAGEYAVNDNFMNAKAEPGFAGTDPGNPREQRIFAVDYNTSGEWTVKAGDLTGNGWVNVATGLAMDAYVDFDVHYRADAAAMDFYWDGSLVGTAATGHGRYDIDLIQFEEVRGSGSTTVRNIRLGHIPEPATGVLFVVGIVAWMGSLRLRS